MAAVTDPFDHGELPKGHIRVFRVTPTVPQVEIELQSFAIEEAPPYEALSYAWGRGSTDQIILCNGYGYRITSHLLEGLRCHYKVFGVRWLWVDAISISQTNNIEKAEQVARMSKIFGSAERVVVWLGPSTPGSDLVFDGMEQVLLTLAVADNSTEEFRFTAQNPSFLAVKFAYWEAAVRLTKRDWFYRLWIVQEAVLARDTVFLCGEKQADWAKLEKWSRVVLVAASVHVHAFAEIVDSEFDADTHGALVLLVIENLRRARGPSYSTISDVLHFAGNKNHRTYEPLDRIYALLGIMHPLFQKWLPVDYSPLFKEFYWIPYVKFIELALTTPDGYMVWDEPVRSRSRVTNQPTWCLNFNEDAVSSDLAPATTGSRDDGAGYILNGSEWIKLIKGFDPLKKKGEEIMIDIDALVVDRVATVFDLANIPTLPFDTKGEETLAVLESILTIQHHLQSLLKWSPWTTDAKIAFARALIGNIRHHLHDPDGCENIWKDYSDAMDYFSSPPKADSASLRSLRIDIPSYIHQMRHIWYGRRFVVTDQGCIGLGTTTTEPGDHVVVIPKAYLPQIFRKTDRKWNDEVLWEVVGNGYVEGLMNGEAFKMFDPANGYQRLYLV